VIYCRRSLHRTAATSRLSKIRRDIETQSFCMKALRLGVSVDFAMADGWGGVVWPRKGQD